MKSTAQPKRANTQLTAIQTSRHFRLTHPRHSGQLVHRKHTSYPVLLMIVLCVGVLLFSWTNLVTASTITKTGSYDVRVRVPGPPPTDPATIDSPLDGDVFTDLPVTVTGTCPADTYVSLFRNGAYSGTALCDADDKYSITTGLFKGDNELMAQDYNFTDVPGPESNRITVTYNPPEPPPQPTPEEPTPTGDTGAKKPVGSTKTGTKPVVTAPTNEPLVLKSQFKFNGVFLGDPTDWQLAVEGGTAPYAVSVDWGDGTTSVISRAKAGSFNLQHVYKKAGGYKGSYTAKFSVSDADGNQAFLQLITIVNNHPHAGIIGNTGSGNGLISGTPDFLQKLVRFIWPGYGVLLLMLTSFWLGERREYRALEPHLKKTRHRHA